MAVLNIQCELACISFLMKEKDPEMLTEIQSDYLANPDLRKILLIIRSFYLDESEFMGWGLLRTRVETKTSPERLKFMLGLLDQMEELDLTGMTKEILLKELKDFHKFRLVMSKAEPLIDAVGKKDIEETLSKLKDMYDSVFVTAEYQLEDADITQMATRKVKFQFRKTGIPQIDERGGLIVGGLTIVAAPAKMGKSTVAKMVAKHQYLEEEGSVAIFSYEMGQAEVRGRILADIADLDLGDLMSDSLNAADQARLLKAEAEFYCVGTEDLKVKPNIDRDTFFEELYRKYEKRSNKLYIFDERLDYDSLMIKMNLLATTRNVKLFIIDYPYLIPRGKAYRDLASWEYQLQVSKNWKTFAHNHQVNVLTPAQLDPGKKGEDPKLRFVTNAINDCDLALYITEAEDDKVLDTVTFTFAAMRNFLTVPGKPGFPQPFKMLKELNRSRFRSIDF